MSSDVPRYLVAFHPKRVSHHFVDVLVIGSGGTGLPAALRARDLGASVLVLEHHYQLGGLATWFKRRGGHIFADTYEEHRANVARWYAIRRARGEM